MSYAVSARAHNLFEVKKIDDCKEGDLIDFKQVMGPGAYSIRHA